LGGDVKVDKGARLRAQGIRQKNSFDRIYGMYWIFFAFSGTARLWRG
jgi:hypothetical protein